MPPAFSKPPPEVALGLELYMKCFWDLVGDRDGLNRIPWMVRHEWCRAKGIDGEDEEDLHFIVSRLDMAYVDWAHKKVKREAQRRKNGDA